MRVRFVLDGEGRRQEVRDHFDRLVLSFEYLDGRLVAARDADGRRVRYAYEGDRLTQVTDVAGQVWRYDYDDQGQLIRRTDPLGGEFRIFYTEPAPAGAFALDGDRARPERSSAVQTSGRLERGLKIARVGSLTDESGRVTRYDYQYDRVSRQYRITTQPPGEDAPRIERYDREGRLLERWVGQERQRLLTRDGERIETLTDARGLQTKTEYDADRRPLAITYADGSRESFEYEAQYGQVVRHIDPLGSRPAPATTAPEISGAAFI